VHRDDVVGIILFVLEHADLSGPVNVAAPEPVTMKQFCKALGAVMGRPSWAPVPAFVLRAMLGEMSDMLLTGQRVVPQKLQEAGYIFRYSKLDEALTAIVGRP
jgi:NAD dependent epimerase/dehydratase family enzyme